MVSKARTLSEQLLCQARSKADGMVTEARTRAQTMLHDARIKAETLDRQSRQKAASLEREAARKHTEIVAALSEETSTLENKVEDLRTFERRYRTHLTTSLQSQLRELDGCSPTAPADSARA
jgi:cell division septum initiation protein DivIVA